MEKYLFIGLSAILGLIILKRFLLRRADKDYDKLYGEILTSDKYKVKGQYDKT